MSSRSERGSGNVGIIGAVITCYVLLVILQLMHVHYAAPLTTSVTWGADKVTLLWHNLQAST